MNVVGMIETTITWNHREGEIEIPCPYCGAWAEVWGPDCSLMPSVDGQCNYCEAMGGGLLYFPNARWVPDEAPFRELRVLGAVRTRAPEL